MRGLFRTILTILWPILACAAVFSQKPDTGSLKGRVKSVVVTTSHFGGRPTTDLHSFDQFGHLIESVSMGDEAESRYRSVYRYDAAGRKTESLRISGVVQVEVTVDEEGNVQAVRSLSGPDQLRRAAEQAARGWKFKPTLLDGMPVKVIGTITFRFSL
jgi:TonB family protein